MTIGYRITQRGFTEAVITDKDGIEQVRVRASSVMATDSRPDTCLRYGQTGEPYPGTTRIWINVQENAAHLNRERAACLANSLTTWLATGFLQPDKQRQYPPPNESDETGEEHAHP